MKYKTKIETNFNLAETDKRKRIFETLGNKLALAYLELIRNKKIDTSYVSNNLNITK